MAIPLYLAMTAAEFGMCTNFPEHMGWMACHFSPYSTGLSNLPPSLPEGSLLILNDRTPIHRHDPSRIGESLGKLAASLRCRGLLLDFQTPGIPETAALARYLAQALPCPVGISEPYAVEGSPVFLPPVPLDTPLPEYLKPWQGQEIWLDAALDAVQIRLTPEGSVFVPAPLEPSREADQLDDRLHCRYRVELEEECARFTLYRTPETVQELLREAESLGVTAAVGLFQEWDS